MDCDSFIDVLRARRAVLQQPLPMLPKSQHLPLPVPSPGPAADGFACEMRMFYSTGPTKTRRTKTVSRAKTARVRKPERKSERPPQRFQPEWTPELDKLLRKHLRKYGWASWTKIESTGRFPKNFNAKIIMRRAKALGYTKEKLDAERAASAKTHAHAR